MTTKAPGETSGLSPRAREVARRFERFREPGNGAFSRRPRRTFVPLDTHDCLPMYFESRRDDERARTRRGRTHRARRADGPSSGALPPTAPMLDLGCAYGGFLVAFAERGFRVTGIEINEALLRLAARQPSGERRGRRAGPGRCDAPRIRPSGTGCDFIAANDVVEHVARLDSFLGNLRDWLTPGGVAYLEIPNGAPIPPSSRRTGTTSSSASRFSEFAPASAYYNAGLRGEVRLRHRKNSREDLASYRRSSRPRGLWLDVLPAATLQGASVDGVLRQLAELESGLDAGLATVPDPLRPARRRARPDLRREGEGRTALHGRRSAKPPSSNTARASGWPSPGESAEAGARRPAPAASARFRPCPEIRMDRRDRGVEK